TTRGRSGGLASPHLVGRYDRQLGVVRSVHRPDLAADPVRGGGQVTAPGTIADVPGVCAGARDQHCDRATTAGTLEDLATDGDQVLHGELPRAVGQVVDAQ